MLRDATRAWMRATFQMLLSILEFTLGVNIPSNGLEREDVSKCGREHFPTFPVPRREESLDEHEYG